MKLKFWKLILIVIIFFNCQNNESLDGNYSICYNGEYTEVYFKADSMRVASDSDWVKLSEWRKIEIKKDTLFFDTFGEWKNPTKAEIKYVGSKNIELWIIDSDELLLLEPITKQIVFEKSNEFWNDFNIRRNYKNCK